METFEQRITPSVSSVFEVGDGNAVTAGTHDWDQVYAGGSGSSATFFTSDPSDSSTDDSLVGGQTKDTNDINRWAWSGEVAVSPSKADLTHAMAAAYFDTNGDKLLYVAGDRWDNSGDSTIGVWFLQKPIAKGTGANAGKFVVEGNNNTLYTHTSGNGSNVKGDLLIVANIASGGGSSTIAAYEWQNGALTLLTGAQGVATVNSTAIPSPWSYAPKTGPSGTIPAGNFFEVGVSLNQIFAGTTLPKVSSFLLETRNANSPSAVLADFVIGKVSSEPDATVAVVGATDSVNSGSPLNFNVTVSNVGLGPLQNVTLNAPLPKLSQLTWSIVDDNLADSYDPNTYFQITSASGVQTLSMKPSITLATTASLTVHVRSNNSINADALANPGPGNAVLNATVGASNEDANFTTNNQASDTIKVNFVNGGPVANNDSKTVNEDSGANTVDVLANDTDPDNLSPPYNAGLTITAKTNGTHGTVAIAPDGKSLTYTPDANYYGLDSFTYTITDGSLTSMATVNITVTNIPDNPVAVNDSKTVDEDSGATSIDVLANDSDADNLSPTAPNAGLTITGNTAASHGTVTIAGNGLSLSYMPAANYYGNDSFTYTITDPTGRTATATVNITVNNIPDDPVAVNDSKTVDEDTGATSINVLANDSDADNLSPTPANAGLTITGNTAAAHGTVTIAGNSLSLSYTPAPNYYGPDSFTYTITDPTGRTATATVNITVNNIPDDPVAVNDSKTVDEDTGATSINVLANDSDADNLSPTAPNAGLTITGNTAAAHGTVTIAGNSLSLSYTPAPNYYGPDSFTYTITDPTGRTATATVYITVNNIPDDPVAVNDSKTVNEDSGATSIDVLANDSDADNLSPTAANANLTITGNTAAAHGTVTIAGNSLSLSYTPAANYYGNDSFTYTITDPTGRTATATVNITVNNVPDDPVAVNDSKTVDEDSGATSIDVLANDSDADNLSPTAANAGLTITSNTPAAHGTVTIAGDGLSLSYTPAANYHGDDSFTYTITDPTGRTATATVNITVTSQNDPPELDPLDLLGTDEGGNINEDDGVVVSGSFTDADVGDTHTVVISWGDDSPDTIINLAAGVTTFSADHQYLEGEPTTYQISATVTDPSNASDTATADINVKDVAPVLATISNKTKKLGNNGEATINLKTSFTDQGTEDTFKYYIDWNWDGSSGPGTFTDTASGGTSTSITDSHIYMAKGVYKVKLWVMDDDGLWNSTTFLVTIF